MKSLQAYIILFAFLFSCAPEKQEEKKILGNKLEDFRACLENPDESFDNVRDLNLGYSLSYPEYWEHENTSDKLFHRLSAFHTIIDTADYSIKEWMSMGANFSQEEILNFDTFMEKVITNGDSGNIGNNFIYTGKGVAFGKACYWAIDDYNLEELKFKVLLLYFPSKDKKHVIIYEYRSLDTDQWYNNICTMLRFKQDV